jgi:hypothetical protein
VKKMARKKKKTGPATFDVGKRLKNISTLVATERPKESIAYMYMLFTMLSRAKYREAKLPSQSIQDYARVMVKNHGLNPGNIYPFVRQVESIIYGGVQPSNDVYRETLDLFSKVFEEIVGKPLPSSVY